MKAPLGPTRHVRDWVYPLDDEGHELVEYWLDEMGHEYNSLDHVLLCAVAKGLEVAR